MSLSLTPKSARQSRGRGTRARATAASAGYHLVGGLLALVFLIPIVWATLNSFKSTQEANQSPPTWFPQSWTLENYVQLNSLGSGLAVYAGNSLLLAVMVVIGTVAVATLAGYGLSRYRFRGRNLLFGSTLLVLMVPFATILIPLFLVMSRLQLVDSVVGLALVQTMFHLPFGVYLMRNSFDSIPIELEEAARVDGGGPLTIFRHISLPLVLPGVVTVALFGFITSWNEFLSPLVFLSGEDSYTLPIMLVNLSSGQFGEVDYGALQAGVVVSIVPVLLLYLFLQRYYVSGLVNGALRG